MSRFLFCSWPYAGHLHPCLALAARLRERGHQIAFYTGAPAAHLLDGEGYCHFRFDRLNRYLAGLTTNDPNSEASLFLALNRRYTTVAEKTPWGRLRKVRQLLREMTAGSIAAQWEDLRAIQQKWRPDAVVTDPMLWAPIVIQHERTGIPVAPFSFYAGCLLPSPRMAVAGLGLPPAASWGAMSRNYVANLAVRALTAPVRREVNRIRRCEGLMPIEDSVHGHCARLPLYLVASSPEFDYQRDDLPPAVQYAGPCLWEPPGECPPVDEHPPVIYVSEGTAQVGEPFLIRATAEALSGQNVQVIATTGPQRDAGSLGLRQIPENVRVFQWLSHREVMGKAKVVVTTGGSNTVRQALASGVPVLAVPLEWDQLENAERLAASGAGIRISRAKCTAASVGAAIQALLHTPQYRENARRIQQSFARLDKANAAIDRLESIAAARGASA